MFQRTPLKETHVSLSYLDLREKFLSSDGSASSRSVSLRITASFVYFYLNIYLSSRRVLSKLNLRSVEISFAPVACFFFFQRGNFSFRDRNGPVFN